MNPEPSVTRRNHLTNRSAKNGQKDIKGNSTKTDALEEGRKTERSKPHERQSQRASSQKNLAKITENHKMVKTQPNQTKRKTTESRCKAGLTQCQAIKWQNHHNNDLC